MAEKIVLQLPITLQDVIKIWARQCGCFEKTVPLEVQEIKYIEALRELIRLFAQHHAQLDDSTFIRIFRFFKDIGFMERLHADSDIAKRSTKLLNCEPDMIPEPVKVPEKETSLGNN